MDTNGLVQSTDNPRSHVPAALLDTLGAEGDCCMMPDVQRLLHPTRRIRLRLTLLAMMALLCQQVAFAAYVCPATAMPAADTATSAACNAMSVRAQTSDTQAATTLCVLHSAQPATVTNNVQLPSVPPLLTPALLPALPTIVASPVASSPRVRSAAWRTSGIPPALRFRVLLI